MLSIFSWFLPSNNSDWCENVREPLGEIESFYKTRTDIPRNIRSKVAKRRLLRIKGISPYIAKTVLKQWDDSLQSSSTEPSTAPRAQSPSRARDPGSTTMRPASNPHSPSSSPPATAHSLASDASAGSPNAGLSLSDTPTQPSPNAPFTKSLVPQTLLLGESLVRAGLINPYQVEVALADANFRSDLKIGEILALRGWVEQETADFFADTLPRIAAQVKRQPIGQYFKAAKLITEEQIQTVLNTQKNCSIRFGELAVAHHYLKRQTLEFMLLYLV